MKAYLWLILRKIVSALRERWHLRLENIALRHQIAVLERSGNRPQFTNGDRLFWVTLSTLWTRWPEALEIVQADTVKRWRRHGFWHYLLGKGRRRRPGRPAIEREIRSLIQRVSLSNVLWGAPRIHGELMKLGVNVCQSTVAKYMVRRPGPPAQSWRTFFRNHTRGLLPSEILPRPINGFRALRTRVTGAVKRWLTAKFHKLLSSHAAPAWDIVDEPISYQSMFPPQNQKVIALIDFASRGPPGVKPLFNNPSLPRMPVTALCPVSSGSMSTFRWTEVAESIDGQCYRPNIGHKERQTLLMCHFQHRSDRFAA